jgi:hypothetical protein
VVKFWDIIKRSHYTNAGLKFSLSDQRNARRRIEDQKQGDKTLAGYDYEFENFLYDQKCLAALDVEISNEELIHGCLSNATDPDLYDEVSLLLRAVGTPQYPNSIAEARGYLNDAKQRKVELMKLRTSMIGKRKQPQIGNNLRGYVNVAADDEDEQVDVEDNPKGKYITTPIANSSDDSGGGYAITSDQLSEMKCLSCDKLGHIVQFCFKIQREKRKGINRREETISQQL